MIIAPFKVTVKIQWSSLQHIAKKFLFGPTQYLTSHRHLIYAGAVLTFNWVYNWAFWNGWDSASLHPQRYIYYPRHPKWPYLRSRNRTVKGVYDGLWEKGPRKARYGNAVLVKRIRRFRYTKTPFLSNENAVFVAKTWEARIKETGDLYPRRRRSRQNDYPKWICNHLSINKLNPLNYVS